MDERVDRTETHRAPAPASRVTPELRHPRQGYRVLTVLILAGLVGGGWYLWTHHQAQQAPSGTTIHRGFQNAPQPVGFATIDRGDIRVILNELGTVTSLDTVTVQTRISGELQKLGFTEGQMVKKGDFLAQIDPRLYQAALDQAKGTLAHDQGLWEQSKADLKRYVTLGRQDSIAQQQVQDQQYLVQQYAGTVLADQGAVETAQSNLDYCRIISPVDGQVGIRMVDQGNYITAGAGTGLVVVAQVQPISVIFAIPEDSLPAIVQRLRAGAALPVEAYDRANNTLLETGTLASLDSQINTTTGTLNIRAMFQNPTEKLYPNQFVNARLLVDTMSNTVRVPVAAVQHGEPGTYVYVINADNTVAVRPIKTGPTDNDFEAVLSGLQQGDRVVTDGTDRLRDGAPVTLPGAQPAAGTTGHPVPPAQDGHAAQNGQNDEAQPSAQHHHKRPPASQPQ